jgi:hypothetical protein
MLVNVLIIDGAGTTVGGDIIDADSSEYIFDSTS